MMTAVIPAAGKGTRFLPVTKAVPKEMLPIGAKPAIELIIDEARSAGADEIVLVISPEKEMVRRYFSDAPDVRFAYQTEQKGLGHAVLQALPAMSEKSRGGNVLVLLGDALVFGCNASREMVDVSSRNGGAAVIGCERVPVERISRYGILKISDGGLVEDLVEKPAPEEAPSDIAIAGRYLLPSSIFDVLDSQAPGKGGEIQLTDAIRRLLPETAIFPYVYPGKRQDIGNPDGYYAALTAWRGIGGANA